MNRRMCNEEMELRAELAKAKEKIDKLYGQRTIELTLHSNVNGGFFDQALYDLVKEFYPDELNEEGKKFWQREKEFNEKMKGKLHMRSTPRIVTWAFKCNKR